MASTTALTLTGLRPRRRIGVGVTGRAGDCIGLRAEVLTRSSDLSSREPRTRSALSDRVRGMLRRDPFDTEDALRRVLIANCDGGLIGRGVIQSLQFVQILELDYDNAGRGCRAFVGDRLTAAHNEFAARVCKRFGYKGEIFLIVPVLVLDRDLSDIVGRWLGLSMEGLDHSSAERSTRDHCQPEGDMPIN